MEYVYPIIMLSMASAILIYAGLLALIKDPMMIPKQRKVRMKNKKAYALMFAKVMALISIPFAASGITGLIWTSEQTLLPAFIVLVLAFIICIYLSSKVVRKWEQDQR